jgi:hypothetical protein
VTAKDGDEKREGRSLMMEGLILLLRTGRRAPCLERPPKRGRDGVVGMSREKRWVSWLGGTYEEGGERSGKHLELTMDEESEERGEEGDRGSNVESPKGSSRRHWNQLLNGSQQAFKRRVSLRGNPTSVRL